MAEGDVDYGQRNNIECEIELNGFKERSLSVVEGQVSRTLSDSKTGLVTTTFSDDLRIRGYQRIHKDWLDDLPTGITYYLLDTRSVPADRSVFVVPIVYFAPTGPIEFSVYENPTIPDVGIEQISFNPNRLTSYAHFSKVYRGTTVSDEGTRLDGDKEGATGPTPVTGNLTSQGSTSDPVLWDRTKPLLFKVNNVSGGIIDYLDVFISWYETPLGV